MSYYTSFAIPSSKSKYACSCCTAIAFSLFSIPSFVYHIILSVWSRTPRKCARLDGCVEKNSDTDRSDSGSLTPVHRLECCCFKTDRTWRIVFTLRAIISCRQRWCSSPDTVYSVGSRQRSSPFTSCRAATVRLRSWSKAVYSESTYQLLDRSSWLLCRLATFLVGANCTLLVFVGDCFCIDCLPLLMVFTTHLNGSDLGTDRIINFAVIDLAVLAIFIRFIRFLNLFRWGACHQLCIRWFVWIVCVACAAIQSITGTFDSVDSIGDEECSRRCARSKIIIIYGPSCARMID